MPISSVSPQNIRRNQRPEGGAGLIQSFVEAKPPALTYHGASVGQQRFDRRSTDCATGAFCDDQTRGHGPVSGQREGRDSEHVDGVAEKSDRPVSASFVREIP